jgi:hypothetical protein
MNVHRSGDINTLWLYLTLIGLLGLNTGCNTGPKIPFKALSEAEKSFLKEQDYETHRYGQFKLYFPKSSFSKEEITNMEAELDRSLDKALRIVGLSYYPNGIHIFLFPDQEAMEKHTGSNLRFMIRPNQDVAYMVANQEKRPYFAHVCFQIMAVEAWGTPKDGILVEGGAFFTDFRCQDISYPFDEIGSYLYGQDSLISLRAIMYDFRKVRAAYPMQTEIEAAAFFQFIYDNFGLEKTKRLWEQGMRRIEGVIGMTPGEIEREIFGRFRNNYDDQDFDWEKLKREGC